ncbi:MAG TPA: Lrp/AsnC family transcriptional regulator [Candidatus Nanoarchaeia archaeon]|nr:Lrp/AsnC family transcriptional regulator [Candidatus Nanoarchaeia archaeon]
MRFLPHLEPEGVSLKQKIDLKDRKILYHLSENARMPASSIAKLTGLSRDSVLYRMKKLEEKKIINCTRTLVDVSKLGYENFHLFVTLNNPEKHIEDKIVKELSGHESVRVILKFHGSYDFEIGFIAKDLHECDKIMQDLVNIMGSNLRYHDLFIITKTLRAGAFPNSFFDKSNIKRELRKNQFSKEISKLDKKDLDLLNSLREDARVPLIDIAKKLKISPDSVSYRLRALEKSGVIISYSPVINYSALGYRVHALMFSIKQFNSDRENMIKRFMESNPHVLWAVKTLGRYDVLLYLCTESEEDFHSFISELRKLFPEQLLRYDSLHAFAEYKYLYAPDVIFKN